MQNSKGFSLIEVLVAASIVFTLVLTTIPITSLLMQEREVLSERRLISSRLHDELQQFLWQGDVSPPASFTRTVNKASASFHFSAEGKFIRGCAEWKNARKQKDKICLYGIPE